MIYVSHSRYFDFRNELYKPLLEIFDANQIILPHQLTSNIYPIKEMLINKQIEYILAEVSYPSTGQGIEFGYADMTSTPVILLAKEDVKLSSSVEEMFTNIIRYKDTADLIDQVKSRLIKTTKQ